MLTTVNLFLPHPVYLSKMFQYKNTSTMVDNVKDLSTTNLKYYVFQVLNIKVSIKLFKMLLGTTNYINLKLVFDYILLYSLRQIKKIIKPLLPKVLPVFIDALLPLAATVTTDFTEPADFPKSQKLQSKLVYLVSINNPQGTSQRKNIRATGYVLFET